MFWELLFGALLILWGFSHIAGAIFNIRIPVFSIIFGLFLLYLGIDLISGFSHWSKNCKSHCNVSVESHVTSMGSSHVTVEDAAIAHQEGPREYKTIMGSNSIDLTHISPEALHAAGAPIIITIDTIFGSTEVILPKNISIRILAKSCCAKVTTPDDCTMMCGTHTYNSHIQEKPLLIIYCSTICGKTIIHTAQ